MTKMKLLALAAIALFPMAAHANTDTGTLSDSDSLSVDIDLSVTFATTATLTLTALADSSAGASGATEATLTFAGQIIPTSDLFGGAATFTNASVTDAGYVRKNVGGSSTPALYAVGALASVTDAHGIGTVALTVTPEAVSVTGVDARAEILAAAATIPTDDGFTTGVKTASGIELTDGAASRAVFVGYGIQTSFSSGAPISNLYAVSVIAE